MMRFFSPQSTQRSQRCPSPFLSSRLKWGDLSRYQYLRSLDFARDDNSGGRNTSVISVCSVVRQFACISILLLLLSAPAHADGVPEAYRGLWASPDCAAPEGVVIYSRWFQLSASLFGLSIRRIETVLPEEDYAIIQSGDEVSALQVTEDALLYEKFLAPDALGAADITFDENDLSVVVHAGCDQPPGALNTLPHNATDRLAELDRLHEACAAGTDKSGRCSQIRFLHLSGDGVRELLQN